MGVLRVLFLCSRNRLRSPTAEQAFATWPEAETASPAWPTMPIRRYRRIN